MPVVTGKGVKPEKAEKALSKSSEELVPGEEVWFFAKCNNLRPMTDALVVTNARVMGLSTGQGFKFRAVYGQIVSTAYDPGAKTVQIVTSTGEEMTFKNVALEDVAAARHYVEHGRQQPAPDGVAAALEQRSQLSAEPSTPEDDEQRFGREITAGIFGLRNVRIYDKGYVRVSLPLMRSKAKFERLVAIEASSDVSKKTGVGRGVGALATGGLNLLGSNKRGDVYLTISTAETTHVLHEDPPTVANLKTAKRLESAGQAVLDAAARDAGTPAAASSAPLPATSPEPRSTAERLRELQQLRAEGLISEAEHEAQRGRLLDGL